MNGIHTARNIHAPRIGTNTDFLFPVFLAGLLQNTCYEIRRKPLRRILNLLLRHNGKRQFRQIITAHVLDIRIANHMYRRIRTVTPKALASANCYFFHPCNHSPFDFHPSAIRIGQPYALHWSH